MKSDAICHMTTKRVSASDVARAGGPRDFLKKLVQAVANGDMMQKEQASASLRSYAEQHADNAELATKVGAIPPLVKLLVIGSSNAQTHAAAALGSISHGRKEHQQAILGEKAILPLATILRSGGPAAQEAAAFAIASVSACIASHKGILKTGSVPPLVSLLKGGSANTQIQASVAVGNLGSLGELGHLVANREGQMAVSAAGGISLLLGLLGSGKAQVAAAQAIARLAHENAPIQREVCKHGGLALLLALLRAVIDGDGGGGVAAEAGAADGDAAEAEGAAEAASAGSEAARSPAGDALATPRSVLVSLDQAGEGSPDT